MTRILVVDPGADQTALQELCEALGRQARLEVSVADSPAAAVEQMGEGQRAAVLLGPHYAHEAALVAAAELMRDHPERLVLALGPDGSVLALRRIEGEPADAGQGQAVSQAVLSALDGEQERREHDAVVERLRRMACIDSLTGMSNRAHFDELYARELRRAERYGTPAAVAMLDVNDFKRINDTLGHLAGDRALQAVSSVIRGNVRGTDVVARYGGDEFVVLMPETVETGARTVIERVVDALAHFNASEGFPVALSLAVGVSTTETSRDPLAAADRLMYEDKHAQKAGR